MSGLIEASRLPLFYFFLFFSFFAVLRADPGIDPSSSLFRRHVVPRSIEKKSWGNLPSEKYYLGTLDLYWQSLLRSGVLSPINSIDSVQRKERCLSLTSFIPPPPGSSRSICMSFAVHT